MVSGMFILLFPKMFGDFAETHRCIAEGSAGRKKVMEDEKVTVAVDIARFVPIAEDEMGIRKLRAATMVVD